MRLSFLDSIRGIAALIVVTAHLHFVAEPQTWFLDLWILRTFKASVFAVSIFFVLSGLVLYLQIEGEKISYPRFVVRRAFRLFPACIVAVTVSYLIYVIWNPPQLTGYKFLNDTTWPPGILFGQYADHLWLGGADQLLRPIWSLVVEWRMSLIFPLIVAIFALSPPLAIIFAISITYFSAGYSMIAFYGCLFVMGVFIAAYRLHIVLFLRSRRWLLGILIAFCGYYVWFRSESNDARGFILQGFVSAALIVFCMASSKMRRLLRFDPLQYLGRISYSLYLVHMIWIGVLFRLMDGSNPLVISAVVIVASIFTASLMNRFVEVPANKFGRRLASNYSHDKIPD